MRSIILWLPTVSVCALFFLLMKQPAQLDNFQHGLTSDREQIRQLKIDSQRITKQLNELEAREHHVIPRGGLS